MLNERPYFGDFEKDDPRCRICGIGDTAFNGYCDPCMRRLYRIRQDVLFNRRSDWRNRNHREAMTESEGK